MKKTILFFAGIIFSSILFEGCLKKGDNDPAISLRSRKARVAGDWKLSSGSISFMEMATGSNYTATFNGSSATISGTIFGFPVNDTYPYTMQLKMQKDGTYESIINDDGDITTEKGNWNFSGGNGDYKKKEQVVLKPTTITDNNGTTTISGTEYDQTYDLDELRHNEMVVKWSASASTSGIGISEVGNLTFTQ
jgi:hypothetical protein